MQPGNRRKEEKNNSLIRDLSASVAACFRAKVRSNAIKKKKLFYIIMFSHKLAVYLGSALVSLSVGRGGVKGGGEMELMLRVFAACGTGEGQIPPLKIYSPTQSASKEE